MNIRKDIKRDDVVVVLSGDQKGSTGKVLKVLPKENKILVEGINVVKKHCKPNGSNPGGIVEKSMPIHISNVSLYDAQNKKPMKVGFKLDDKSLKVRYNKKTNVVLD